METGLWTRVWHLFLFLLNSLKSVLCPF